MPIVAERCSHLTSLCSRPASPAVDRRDVGPTSAVNFLSRLRSLYGCAFGYRRKRRRIAKYAGMTVNERLFEASKLKAFDEAARGRDRTRMIKIFVSVGVQDAEWTADAILGAPEKYGF